MIFNESCEHEVWIPSSLLSPLIVLIIDVNNPFLKHTNDYVNNFYIGPESGTESGSESGSGSGAWDMSPLMTEYDAWHLPLRPSAGRHEDL